MSTPSVLGFDVTGDNLSHAPSPNSGLQAALYVTGTGGVAASPAQLAAYPKALRIAQWPTVSVDESAEPDYFDLENSAITTADLAVLIPDAISRYHSVSRPGQRWPAVYCGDNTSPTAVANELNANGLGSSGVGLILVRWGLSQAEAEALLTGPASSSNPFPVVGVQFSDHGPNGEPYDQDVFAEWWVNTVATATPPPVKAVPPPGQWNTPSNTWEWQQVQIVGRGMDNVLYTFEYRVKENTWVRISTPEGS